MIPALEALTPASPGLLMAQALTAAASATDTDNDAGTQAARVLIVDDERPVVEMLSRLMKRIGYEAVTASNGADALALVSRERPDTVILDINMPGIDGVEVCRRLKADPATRLIPIILLTGLSASADRIRGIAAGADDFVTKPPVLAELTARVRALTRLKRYTDTLDSAEAVIMSLGLTIEARDPHTQGHCQRLARFAGALGRRIGLHPRQLVTLQRGAFLHDVGKIAIPDSILLKPGPLSQEEREVMQQHTIVGDNLCRQLRLLDDVCPIVRHHHERPDGTGYPDGLRGDEIPLLAQILRVVDVYDALRSRRPYKPELPRPQALEKLRTEAAKGWISQPLVEVFAALPGLEDVHDGPAE